MQLRVAQFLTIMLFALVVGVFWGTWFSLSRSIATITPETFLEVGKAIISNLAVPMRALMPGAILSALITLMLVPDKTSVAFYGTLIGAILMIGTLGITLAVNVPIDNQIRAWTVNSLPSNWREMRKHWETYHAIRTFVSIAGLASILIGTLTTS